MYIPLLASLVYLTSANYYMDDKSPNLTVKHIGVVLRNLLIIESIYTVAWFFDLFNTNDGLSVHTNLFNTVLIFIIQDVWFYSIHKLLHNIPKLYVFHKQHHEVFGPFHTWHASVFEHIAVNIMSFVVPSSLFPLHVYAFHLLIAIQSWSSVSGRINNAFHEIHHTNGKKRFGTLYIIDRLVGSY
jgi:sterol desaturase/sphingolipid hydroxylase (fatty acid hydroxylase superfamily)